MASLRFKNRFRPHCEPLEDRVVPTGIVTISTNRSGDLIITGDSRPNDISLAMSGNELTITANDDTILNGVGFSGETEATYSEFANIVIRLNSGDDVVTVAHCDLPHSLSIETSFGADTISIGASGSELRVHGSINVNGGTGDDTITLANFLVDGSVLIKADLGNNTTTLTGFDEPGNDNIEGSLTYIGNRDRDDVTCSLGIRGSAKFDLGAGTNTLSLDASTVGGALFITGGKNADSLTVTNASSIAGKANISLGIGTNTFTTDGASTFLGALTVTTGVQADTFSLSGDCVFAGTVTINGLGSDTFTAESCLFEAPVKLLGSGTFTFTGANVDTSLDLHLGSGADVVTLEQTAVDGALAIFTAAGDDEVTLNDVNVSGSLQISTGAGNDTIAIDGGEFQGVSSITTSTGNDVVTLAGNADTTFADSLTVFLDANADALDLGSGGTISLQGDRNRFVGGDGSDTFTAGTIDGDFVSSVFERTL